MLKLRLLIMNINVNAGQVSQASSYAKQPTASTELDHAAATMTPSNVL